MSGRDIRTGARVGRWGDFVDIARFFRKMVRISGGRGGGFQAGVGLADIPGHGSPGRKDEAPPAGGGRTGLGGFRCRDGSRHGGGDGFGGLGVAGGGCAAVLGYLLLVIGERCAFSSAIHHLRSPWRTWRLGGEYFRMRGRAMLDH